MDSQQEKPDLTQFDFAHPGKRFQGQFVDGLITYGVGVLAFYLLHNIVGKDMAFYIAATIGMSYFLFSDALPNGQSLGKKLIKAKVINIKTKQDCSLFESLLRNITFPLGVIDWVFIFFGSHQRVGDFIASTVVVKTEQ